MIKQKIKHPSHKTKKPRREKKQWPPSKYPNQSGKRQRKDWRCGERPPNRKKGVLLEEKQANKELDLESKEHPTSCEDQSQKKQFREWSPSLRGMERISRRPAVNHLNTVECELQISFGEVLQGKDGPTPKKESWKEKLRVKNEDTI